MSDDRKSGVQKLFTGMVPATTAADMEAHSRAWMLQCPKCGYERSIWDMGGIRYKATGNSRNFMRCVSCGKRSWHKMYKREGPVPEVHATVTAAPTATAPATAARGLPRWLQWGLPLGTVAVVAAILSLIVLGCSGYRIPRIRTHTAHSDCWRRLYGRAEDEQ
jgi:predicted RNA-binding Zn-ribbon protein involved in translation (DUF1610 family)